MKFITWELVIKMSYIFTDENKTWQFDFSSAIWATDQLHDIFQCVKDGVLCDVDFVVEDEYNLYFIECKNSNFAGVTKPDAHKMNNGEIWRKLARKYWDSLHYIQRIKQNKSKNKIYVCIIESRSGGTTDRKKLRLKLRDRLPFNLQIREEFDGKLISDVEVVNLDEWNEKYKNFPALRLK